MPVCTYTIGYWIMFGMFGAKHTCSDTWYQVHTHTAHFKLATTSPEGAINVMQAPSSCFSSACTEAAPAETLAAVVHWLNLDNPSRVTG